eukprot:COSAG01_NODE_10537_length_2137_cov_2.062316_2_plen_29_part_01
MCGTGLLRLQGPRQRCKSRCEATVLAWGA